MLIWGLVSWMEWILLTDAALLDVHLFVVAVIDVHFVEVINNTLSN